MLVVPIAAVTLASDAAIAIARSRPSKLLTWKFGGVQTTPDPNTSAKISRYKWEAHRDTNWWCIYYFLPRGGHTFAKVRYRDRNGRCIAILFKSIGVRVVYFLSSLRGQTAKTLICTKSGVSTDSRKSAEKCRKVRRTALFAHVLHTFCAKSAILRTFRHSFWNRRKPHFLCRLMFLPFGLWGSTGNTQGQRSICFS